MGGMGVLIIFAAGISVGFAVDKLYHAFVISKKQEDGELAVVVDEEVDSKAEPLHEAEPEVGVGGAVRNELPAEEVKEVGDNQHNDLGQLKGAGPKLVKALGNIGIFSYAQLSTSSVDILFERLKETGGRFSRPVVSSVVEQAKMVTRGVEEA